MPEIFESSQSQSLRIHLHAISPLFRVKAQGLASMELSRVEGFILLYFIGKVLHLDIIRKERETLAMERSIFGLGLFNGAAANVHG